MHTQFFFPLSYISVVIAPTGTLNSLEWNRLNVNYTITFKQLKDRNDKITLLHDLKISLVKFFIKSLIILTLTMLTKDFPAPSHEIDSSTENQYFIVITMASFNPHFALFHV
ncbi:unnamed protein product [Adineta ricciae]|uniref:Uncharacterized protein n=1 Tax=Adineta ricciae TaxID=249248 RepID=A0A815S271_ADIRI|nr:unnamed protein product [Adineta ricciae]